MSTEINAPATCRLFPLLRDLFARGWRPTHAPTNGRLVFNRQKMILRSGNQDLAVRLSFFSVTDSARGRPHERRIEITTTYARGLQPDPVFRDVVIGFERNQQTYVGVDPRRLFHGGPTSNASTFFSISGLGWTDANRLLVLPYSSELFGGTEYHAFFESSRFAEYLFNLDAIHAGSYTGTGPFSRPPAANRRGRIQVPDQAANGDVQILAYATGPPSRSRPTSNVIEQFESGQQPRRGRRISAEDFAAIQQQREENGLLGEQYVLDFEKRRLVDGHRRDLAQQIEWVSRESVGEGYDIKSFETTGDDRLIEVKATVGNGRTFEMSNNEWQTASMLGNEYHIYRVFQVRSQHPRIETFRDPCHLENTDQIRKVTSGWRVTLL